MMRTSLRLAAVACAAVSTLITTSAPAQAGPDSFLSRTTGFVGITSWVQYFDFPGDLYGNVHVGFLQAFETAPGAADVFAYIDDYDCPEGVYPDPFGGPGACTYAGARQLQGTGIAFTVGQKASTATLKGSLTASTPGDPHTGEGGTTIGLAPADFTWTADGDVARSRSTYRYDDGNGTTISETYSTTSRQASMSGQLGPMLFQEAYQAQGSLETFKSTSRRRG